MATYFSLLKLVEIFYQTRLFYVVSVFITFKIEQLMLTMIIHDANTSNKNKNKNTNTNKDDINIY